MNFRLARVTVLLMGVLLFHPLASAGEKALLHCFFFTPIAEASQADWDAYYKATDELPSKIDGLHRVWVGKLTERAAVAQQVKLGREYGACMEFRDEAALASYATHAAHDAWLNVYEKVRVAGTTTFDILGQ
ncbi:MAG: Dabb family protein [Acidobacteria bacterium]|nr:Dabb family protein [Acidobacteriota bacterium]